MDTPLSKQKCEPCEGGTKPLAPREFSVYLPQVPGWKVIEDKALTKEFEFKDFSLALSFIDKVGARAEQEGHHPDIALHDYKFVTIILSTHKIGGLSVNDFILATKIDEL